MLGSPLSCHVAVFFGCGNTDWTGTDYRIAVKYSEWQSNYWVSDAVHTISCNVVTTTGGAEDNKELLEITEESKKRFSFKKCFQILTIQAKIRKSGNNGLKNQ